MLVLLPGLGTDHRMWMLQQPRLSTEYHVLGLNLPGFGNPEPINVDTGSLLWSYVDWAADEISSANRGKCTLVGYSMGGTLTLMIALKYPELVEKIALVCTSSCWGEGPRGALRWLAQGPVAGVACRLMLWRVESHIGKFLDEPSQKSAIKAMVDEADQGLMAKLLGELALVDLRSRLGELKVPSLVIAGGRDWTAPVSHSRTLVRGLGNARFHIAAEADHFLIASRPDWLSTKIAAFASEEL